MKIYIGQTGALSAPGECVYQTNEVFVSWTEDFRSRIGVLYSPCGDGECGSCSRMGWGSRLDRPGLAWWRQGAQNPRIATAAEEAVYGPASAWGTPPAFVDADELGGGPFDF